MGAKGSKKKPATSGSAASVDIKPLPAKQPELDENAYQFLTAQTGLSRTDIKSVFDKFSLNNPDGKLDRQEFVRLYNSLRF
jgi:hypothetical protein